MKEKLIDLYAWALDTRAANFNIFVSGNEGGNGAFYLFLLAVGVPLIVTAIYYFVLVKSSINNDTENNYLACFVVGLFATILGGLLLLTKFSGGQSLWADSNFWMATLVNSLYYIVLFELFSYLFMSAAHSNTHMFNLFK
jgi:hypothetical protein